MQSIFWNRGFIMEGFSRGVCGIVARSGTEYDGAGGCRRISDVKASPAGAGFALTIHIHRDALVPLSSGLAAGFYRAVDAVDRADAHLEILQLSILVNHEMAAK